ncbi:hypothetical protein QAD02_016779 [Eretmocerus hayati]|uniref:Uncharacterized protein n=1 Tax=Eretmocerus hayati TaxID=131215 RepID=A0ACC2PCF8_9HYME|nr:hypothetical protein QAD02_016779 [Eretmocerus hayati]
MNMYASIGYLEGPRLDEKDIVPLSQFPHNFKDNSFNPKKKYPLTYGSDDKGDPIVFKVRIYAISDSKADLEKESTSRKRGLPSKFLETDIDTAEDELSGSESQTKSNEQNYLLSKRVKSCSVALGTSDKVLSIGLHKAQSFLAGGMNKDAELNDKDSLPLTYDEQVTSKPEDNTQVANNEKMKKLVNEQRANKEKMKELQAENEKLRKDLGREKQNKRELKDKYIKIKQEFQTVTDLNRNLQQQILDRFSEQDTIAEQMKNTKEVTVQDNYPPIGYIRPQTKMLHLGDSLFIHSDTYHDVASTSKPFVFVGNILVKLFSIAELKAGTITGKPSNKTIARLAKLQKENKKKEAEKLQRRIDSIVQLDKQKLLTCRKAYELWLRNKCAQENTESSQGDTGSTQLNFPVELNNFDAYVTRKVSNLKSPPRRQKGSSQAPNSRQSSEDRDIVDGQQQEDQLTLPLNPNGEPPHDPLAIPSVSNERLTDDSLTPPPGSNGSNQSLVHVEIVCDLPSEQEMQETDPGDVSGSDEMIEDEKLSDIDTDSDL